MKQTRIGKALNRAVLASLATPVLLAYGAATTGCSGRIASSGERKDADGGGSSSSGGASGSSGSGSGSSSSGGASGSSSGGSGSGSSGGGSGSTSDGGGSDSSAHADGSSNDSCPVTTYVPVYGGTGSGRCLLAPYACGTPLPTACAGTYDLAQPSSDCNPQDGGALSADLCVQLCPDWYGGALGCTVFEDTGGGHVTCGYPCPTGRRPEGLHGHVPKAESDAVAAHLAQMAHLEAASVVAFDRLTRELEAHAAPEHLRAASRAAARDEKRHASTTRSLAERLGVRVPRVRVEPHRVRPLLHVAVENAVEGCVHETFGAAVAMIQARRAADTRVRRAMKRIARDEVRHAELSWAVARWLDTQLDAQQRLQVREARARAVAALFDDVSFGPDQSLIAQLGVPSAREARHVVRELSATLWSRQAAT